VIVLFIATGVLNAFVGPYVEGVRNFILHPFFQSLPKRFASRDFSYSLLAGLRGGITIGGLAAAIKLMKYWYVKEQSNLQLQKEKAQIQLQLLKAQVHPHFLFNTLNNIYSFTQISSPEAAKMVAGLSDMLRYMLYEGDKPLVPLAKELNMLRDYIMLEQVRYGARLDVHMDIPNNTDDLYITPLILLPLVENCFKHGASNMVEQSWINMTISIEDDWMNMKLVNGKARDYNIRKVGTGIGLQNVQKRLELIYPQQHFIKVTDEDDVFIVDLKIGLQRITANRQIIMPVELMPANA
jgi:LytS/YehU family sensor histidine kinase